MSDKLFLITILFNIKTGYSVLIKGYEVIYEKNLQSTEDCFAGDSINWQNEHGYTYSTCYNECTFASSSETVGGVVVDSSSRQIEISIPVDLQSISYHSFMVVQMIYAKQLNTSLQTQIQADHYISNSSPNPSYSYLEKQQSISCLAYQNLDFDYATALFPLTSAQNRIQLTITFPSLVTSALIRSIRVWINCTANCQICLDSLSCLKCSQSFKSYTLDSGREVCEQTHSCRINNCFSCAQDQSQSICMKCQLGYYLNQLGSCQIYPPQLTCQQNEYYNSRTSQCETMSQKCMYQDRFSKQFVSCQSIDSSLQNLCMSNEVLLLYDTNLPRYYDCTTILQRCQYFTTYDTCHTCLTTPLQYYYDPTLQICSLKCSSADQYYDPIVNGCFFCTGQFCNSCNYKNCTACKYYNYVQDYLNPQNCVPCTLSNCSLCQLNGVECQICDQGYYLHPIWKSCGECEVNNCSACDSDNSQLCKQCNSNYKQSIDRKACRQIILPDTENRMSIAEDIEDNGYSLLISFERDLIIADNSNLEMFFDVSIDNVQIGQTTAVLQSERTIAFNITLNADCKDKQLQLSVIDSDFSSANSLDTNLIKVDLPNYVKLSQLQKQQAQNVEAVNQGVTESIVSSIAPIAIFGNFYIIFNTIDMTSIIYYLLFINVRYPINMIYFCNVFQYFQFPFIPNIFLKFINPNYTQYAPSKFKENQTDAYFLKNAGQSLTICIGITSIFIFYKIMSYFPHSKIQNYFVKSLRNTWHYSGLLDMVGTVYIYLSVGMFLQFYSFDTTDSHHSAYLNYTLFSLTFLFILLFPFALLYLFYKDFHLNQPHLHSQTQIQIEIKKKRKETDLRTKEKGHRKYSDDLKRDEKGVLKREESGDIKREDSGDLKREDSGDLKREESGDLVMKDEDDFKRKYNTIVNGVRLYSKNDLEQFQQESQSKYDFSKSCDVFRYKQRLYQIKLSRYVNPISYMRKLIFSFLIVFLHNYTPIQIMLISLLNMCLILYYFYIQPFNQIYDNIKNGLSEVCLIIIQTCCLILKDDSAEQTESSRITLGWYIVISAAAIILMHSISILQEMFTLIYRLAVYIYHAINRLLSKPKESYKQTTPTTYKQHQLSDNTIPSNTLNIQKQKSSLQEQQIKPGNPFLGTYTTVQQGKYTHSSYNNFLLSPNNQADHLFLSQNNQSKQTFPETNNFLQSPQLNFSNNNSILSLQQSPQIQPQKNITSINSDPIQDIIIIINDPPLLKMDQYK